MEFIHTAGFHHNLDDGSRAKSRMLKRARSAAAAAATTVENPTAASTFETDA
jgi:hypothetical protein